MTLRKFGIIIGVLVSPMLALILLLICSEAFGMTLTMMGYYVNKPGWEIGELAAKKNDVSICNKMRQTWFVIGPQSGEQERLCVFTFAEKAHDPTACELLLPSSYGINCIGAATHFPQQECIQVHPNKLNCYIAEKDILKIYDVPQIENCELYKKYSNHQVIHWCFGERAKKYGELDKCLQDASKDIEKDDCYYQRAMKLDDLQLAMCEKIISNTLMRGDCTETVKAWIKYPELRPTQI